MGKDAPQQTLNAPNGTVRDQAQEVYCQRLEYAHRHIVRDQSDQRVWKLDRAEASPALHKCGRSQWCVMGMSGGAHLSRASLLGGVMLSHSQAGGLGKPLSPVQPHDGDNEHVGQAEHQPQGVHS